jgi:hypothetical protein
MNLNCCNKKWAVKNVCFLQPVLLLFGFEIEDGFIAVESIPILFKACNRNVGHGVGKGILKEVGGDGNRMATGKSAFMNLLNVLKAGSQYLAIQTVAVELLNDLFYNTGAIANNVIESVHVGSYEIGTCGGGQEGLGGGEDGGYGNADIFFLQHHNGLKTFFADGDLNKKVTADLIFKKLCFLNDLFRFGLHGLNVEHFIGPDDIADLLDQLPKFHFFFRNEGGVGGYTRKRIKFVAMLNVGQVAAIQHVLHFSSPLFFIRPYHITFPRRCQEVEKSL